jgi:hypothetical protein
MQPRQADILQNLEQGLRASTQLFADLDEEQLALKVYSDGLQWTVAQVLAHLVAIEQSMQHLFESILQGGPGSPKEFDIERFNRSQTKKLEGHSQAVLLERLSQVRSRTKAMVAEMSDADLDRQGFHAFHGHGRLERFIRWAYEHAALHEADIRKALART